MEMKGPVVASRDAALKLLGNLEEPALAGTKALDSVVAIAQVYAILAVAESLEKLVKQDG